MTIRQGMFIKDMKKLVIRLLHDISEISDHNIYKYTDTVNKSLKILKYINKQGR